MKFAGIVHIFDLIEQRNLYVSGYLAEQLGYTKEEIQAMGMFALATLVHPDDLFRVAEYFQRFSGLQPGEILEINYRMRRADGRWCWLRSRETPYLRTTKDSSPQLIGIVEEIDRDELTGLPDLGETAPSTATGGDRPRYWIEVVTREPDDTYYLGPFDHLAETEYLYGHYFENLQGGENGDISIAIKHGQSVPSRAPLKVVP